MADKRVVLVGVEVQSDDAFAYTMVELRNLAQANGYEVVREVSQKLEHTQTAFYIGKGKLDEIVALVAEEEIDAILFNDELSPSQLRNISDVSPCVILDRTMVILDIFASRANTKEALLQVEISRLSYELPRLVGMNEQLGRQGGGGFYNRGGGETKLELDRRGIEARIAKQTRELKKMVQERQIQRDKRKKSAVKTIALVGYTNAGKSSLMNALIDKEDKQVYVQDMLFATLETRVRKVELGHKYACLLSDTVGFIDKLPHHLIQAFRSTLEEVKEADLLLHVIDGSNPYYQEQMQITLQTLNEIGVKDIPILNVYNKVDLLAEVGDVHHTIYVSATKKIGIESLKQQIISILFPDYKVCVYLFPYTMGSVVSFMNDTFEVLELENKEQGIYVKANVSKQFQSKYKEYEIKWTNPLVDK